ncbi:MAG TPA: hypothetical protein PLQ95_10540 [Thiobacillus sp.]|nr:hypothetical protein [Thiobacillus sp.]
MGTLPWQEPKPIPVTFLTGSRLTRKWSSPVAACQARITPVEKPRRAVKFLAGFRSRMPRWRKSSAGPQHSIHWLSARILSSFSTTA